MYFNYFKIAIEAQLMWNHHSPISRVFSAQPADTEICTKTILQNKNFWLHLIYIL